MPLRKTWNEVLEQPSVLDIAVSGPGQPEGCLRVPFSKAGIKDEWRAADSVYFGTAARVYTVSNPDVLVGPLVVFPLRIGVWAGKRVRLSLESGVGFTRRRPQDAERDPLLTGMFPFTLAGDFAILQQHVWSLNAQLGYSAALVLRNPDEGEAGAEAFFLHGPRAGLVLSFAPLGHLRPGFRSGERHLSIDLELPLWLMLERTGGSTRAALAPGLGVSVRTAF